MRSFWVCLTIIIFWKKRLWFTALKCVHNQLAGYNKCESAVVVGERVLFRLSDLDEVLSGEFLGHPSTQWDLFIWMISVGATVLERQWRRSGIKQQKACLCCCETTATHSANRSEVHQYFNRFFSFLCELVWRQMHSSGSPVLSESSHYGFDCWEKHSLPEVEVADPKWSRSKCKKACN